MRKKYAFIGDFNFCLLKRVVLKDILTDKIDDISAVHLPCIYAPALRASPSSHEGEGVTPSYDAFFGLGIYEGGRNSIRIKNQGFRVNLSVLRQDFHRFFLFVAYSVLCLMHFGKNSPKTIAGVENRHIFA